MTEQGVSLELLKERLEREPCAGAMHLLAETYYQQGQHLLAATVSRQALSRYPENLGLRLLLGQSLASLGEYDEADEILKPLVEEIAHLGEVFRTLHHLYQGQGRVAAADQAGEIYRLLQEGLAALFKDDETLVPSPAPLPAQDDRRRRHLYKTLAALEKWREALQSN